MSTIRRKRRAAKHSKRRVRIGDIRIDSNDLDAYITAGRQEPERAALGRR